MESIIGCPSFVSYNEWLENIQNEIFEDTSYYERGPDGEFIYVDHFDSLYSDDEEGIESPGPMERTEICSCEICGTVGHASAGCPILTDPQFDWWKGAPMKLVPLLAETPLEHCAKDKSGVSPGHLVMNMKKPLVQNSALPLNNSLTPSSELEIFYIFIIFTILMEIYFPGKHEDWYIQDEEENSEDREPKDLREIVEQEEDLRQESHYLTKYTPRDVVSQANGDDVNFILPSFISASSSAAFHGDIDVLLEEENNRKNIPVYGDDVKFILPSFLNLSPSVDFRAGIEFLLEEENNKKGIPVEKGEEESIMHLDLTTPENQPILSLGNPEGDEEYQSMGAPLESKNSHSKWEKPPKCVKGSMHCSPRPKRAVRHGQRKFPFDRG